MNKYNGTQTLIQSGKLSTFCFLAVLLSIIFSSCTVQKRLHRKGWNVQWHHNKSGNSKTKENSDKTAYQARKNEDNKAVNTIPKETKAAEKNLGQQDMIQAKDNTTEQTPHADPTKKSEPTSEEVEKETVSKNKIKNDTGVSAKDAQKEPQSNYELLIAGAIISFALAGGLFFLGLVMATWNSLNIGFAIPDLFLISAAAFVVLGIAFLVIFIDRKAFQNKSKSSNSNKQGEEKSEELRGRNKKRDTIGMIIIFLGVVTMIVLAALH